MINGYLSVGGPMCAQSISVLNIITFTDYSSANITILCASLASRQWNKYSLYAPICCECIYQSKGQKLFELTCKMQISLPLNLVSIALKVPCGIIVLKFNLVRSFNFSLDNQTNKKLVSGGLNKDKKRTLHLLSLNIPHTSFKFKLGPPAKKHRGREGHRQLQMI